MARPERPTGGCSCLPSASASPRRSCSGWRRPGRSSASAIVPASAPGPDRRAGRGQLRAAHRRRPAGACAGPRDDRPSGFRLRARHRGRPGAGGARLRVGFGPGLPRRTAGRLARVAGCRIRGAGVHAAARRPQAISGPSRLADRWTSTSTTSRRPSSRRCRFRSCAAATSSPATRTAIVVSESLALWQWPGEDPARPAVRGQHRRRRRGQRAMGGAAGSGCGGDVLPGLGRRCAVAGGAGEDLGSPEAVAPLVAAAAKAIDPGSSRRSGCSRPRLRGSFGRPRSARCR